jgi:four helix bundle protein
VGDYRDLVAYRLSLTLAAEVRRRVLAWPSLDRWTIGTQLLRAAGSIGANIAEGEGRWHGKDRARFLVVARGSLFETRHWLDLASEAGLPGNDFDKELTELGRTLNGLIAKARALASNS